MYNSNKYKFFERTTYVLFSTIICLLYIETIFLSWILFVIVLIWLLTFNKNKFFSFINQLNPLHFLPLLYIIYIIGLFYSQNLNYGFQKLETKFGLFLFPFLLNTFNLLKIKENFWKYVKLYIISGIIITIILFVRSSILFLYELYCRKYNIILNEYPYTNYFFSTYISPLMHYGYFAMYLNVAIALIYQSILNKIYLFKKIEYTIPILIWLSLFIILLNSKAGIICNILNHIYYFTIFSTNRFKIKTIISFLGSFIIVLIFLFSLPDTKKRINLITNAINGKNMDSTSIESTQLRYFTWKASLELIKESKWYGYGTGDASDALINKYKEKNYLGAYSKQLNAHNQFLQTYISIGLIGSLFLISFFVFAFWYGFRHQNNLLLIFLIITFTSFLFESYLETSAGVIFFSFFSSFLINLQKSSL